MTFREFHFDGTNSDHCTIRLGRAKPKEARNGSVHICACPVPCDSGQPALESDSEPYEVPLRFAVRVRSAVRVSADRVSEAERRVGGLPPLQIGGLERFCQECS